MVDTIKTKTNTKYCHDLGIYNANVVTSINANRHNPAIVAALIMDNVDSNAIKNAMRSLFVNGCAWYEANDVNTLALFVLLNDIATLRALDLAVDCGDRFDYRFAVSFELPDFNIE